MTGITGQGDEKHLGQIELEASLAGGSDGLVRRSKNRSTINIPIPSINPSPLSSSSIERL
jgi:hypothetical protein